MRVERLRPALTGGPAWRRPGPRRLVAAAAVTLLVTGSLSHWPARGTQSPPDPAGPAVLDLLESPPFDRVTLIDGKVLDVEPVSPRPLPPLDPDPAKATRKPAGKPARDEPPRENVRVDPVTGRLELLGDLAPPPDTPDVPTTLLIKPLGEPNVYRVDRASITSIDYFEDLLLAAGQQQVDRQQYARAFEHFMRAAARDPAWPTLAQQIDRLLLAEGTTALENGNLAAGLRLLNELRERSPGFEGLTPALSRGYCAALKQALDANRYAEGRSWLRALTEVRGTDHPDVSAARSEFEQRAQTLLDRAQALDDPEPRLDTLAQAVAIWPELPGADAAYRAAFLALPTLEVAVLDLTPRPGPWIHGPADARIAPLLHLNLLAGDDQDALDGKRRDQLASGLETRDLGRLLQITLRTDATWSDGSGPVAVADLARTLTAWCDPASPLFRADWSALLNRIDVVDARSARVGLTRSALKPSAWLRLPLVPAHAGSDAQVESASNRQLVTSGPYTLDLPESSDRLSVFRARDDFTPQAPAIARVRERLFLDPAAAARALQLGQVSLLAHVPPQQERDLATTAGVRLGRYRQPRLHVIALDGRSPALRSRTLRRALSNAIDRAALLDAAIADAPRDPDTTPLNGPFPTGSYANVETLPPLPYEPTLARLLVAAARQELGNQPLRFRLLYPARPEVRAIIPRLVEAWTRAGLDITAVERPETELEADLHAGQPFELAYRVAVAREPILQAGVLISPGFNAAPESDPLAAVASPRIRQLLLELEQASAFPTAREIVRQIDQESRDELPLIPLWQVVDHYAWRDHLTGPTETADELYEGIPTWLITPVIPSQAP